MRKKLIEIQSTLSNDYSYVLIDIFYSYLQYLNISNQYEISVVKDKSDNLQSLKVYLLDFFQVSKAFDPKNYDIVFITNAAEPLNVFDNKLLYLLDFENCYAIVGSFVDQEHLFARKLISLPSDWINCRPWYSNSCYFTSFYTIKNNDKDLYNISFINGKNRSVRNYFLNTVKESCDKIINNNPIVTETQLGGIFSDSYDRIFIEQCNKKYKIAVVKKSLFYRTIKFGIQNNLNRQNHMKHSIFYKPLL